MGGAIALCTGGALVALTSYRAIWPFTAAFLLLAALLMSRVRVQKSE